MSLYTFLVLTNAKDGRDDEFNDWYTNTHLADVVKIDGFVAAQRFRIVDGAHEQTPSHRYMALYEIEADDLTLVQKALAAAAESGEMPVSSSLDADNVSAWYFEAMTDRVVAPD